MHWNLQIKLYLHFLLSSTSTKQGVYKYSFLPQSKKRNKISKKDINNLKMRFRYLCQFFAACVALLHIMNANGFPELSDDAIDYDEFRNTTDTLSKVCYVYK